MEVEGSVLEAHLHMIRNQCVAVGKARNLDVCTQIITKVERGMTK